MISSNFRWFFQISYKISSIFDISDKLKLNSDILHVIDPMSDLICIFDFVWIRIILSEFELFCLLLISLCSIWKLVFVLFAFWFCPNWNYFVWIRIILSEFEIFWFAFDFVWMWIYYVWFWPIMSDFHFISDELSNCDLASWIRDSVCAVFGFEPLVAVAGELLLIHRTDHQGY